MTVPRELRTPRAAAVAGVLFAIVLGVSQLIIQLSVGRGLRGPATEVLRHARAISLALDLLPVAGITFLWFVAVIRDRLGEHEDRFFTTVLLGAGILYVAMVFAAAAVAGALLTVPVTGAPDAVGPGVYALAAAQVRQFTSYASRMAGVVMISGSTIFLRTRIVGRWLALTGYVLALVLLLSSDALAWVPLVFPLWVLLVSVHILVEGRRRSRT